jgi:hypothetical protein
MRGKKLDERHGPTSWASITVNEAASLDKYANDLLRLVFPL